MCHKCAKNPEWCQRVKDEFEERKEELVSETTKHFSRYLTAMEKMDYYTVAKVAMELAMAFHSTAEALSLAYAKEFLLKAAQEVAEDME